mgnify:FL=1
MLRMAEFCAVLHQALDGIIVSQKIRKIVKEDRCVRFSRQNKFM